jgi:hypothetical protein
MTRCVMCDAVGCLLLLMILCIHALFTVGSASLGVGRYRGFAFMFYFQGKPIRVSWILGLRGSAEWHGAKDWYL